MNARFCVSHNVIGAQWRPAGDHRTYWSSFSAAQTAWPFGPPSQCAFDIVLRVCPAFQWSRECGPCYAYQDKNLGTNCKACVSFKPTRPRWAGRCAAPFLNGRAGARFGLLLAVSKELHSGDAGTAAAGLLHEGEHEQHVAGRRTISGRRTKTCTVVAVQHVPAPCKREDGQTRRRVGKLQQAGRVRCGVQSAVGGRPRPFCRSEASRCVGRSP